MEKLGRLTGKKFFSEAEYGAHPCKLLKYDQSACGQITKATAQLKICRIAAEIYSEEARFNLRQALKHVSSRKITNITCSSLFSSSILEKKWQKPAVMISLLTIYKQFINTFYNGKEAAKVTKRLSEFLLALDDSKDYSALLDKYHQKSSLTIACIQCLKYAKESFCEQHITFFSGILVLLIELKKDQSYLEYLSFLPFHFLMDFLLAQSSEDGSSFFLNKESMTEYFKMVDKKIKQFEFLPRNYIPIKTSPLAFLVNNIYWSEIYGSDTGHPENALWSHYYNFMAPQYLCDMVFNGSSFYDQSYYDELTVTISNSPVLASFSAIMPFNPDQIKIGEEFEFYFTNEMNYTYSVNEIITKWYRFISKKMISMHIPKLEYFLKKGENEDELFFTFGNWHCMYYRDCGIFEVNCSPYTIDQYFTCNGKNYTTYELFDLFINKPADEFLLQGRSGHKHIDIRHSIANNPELLFRFLLDVENESFLTKALGREDRCEEWFPYLFMSNKADQYKTLIDRSVELINKKISVGKSPQSLAFYTHAYVFKNLWDLSNEYSPAKIRLAPKYINDHKDTKICKPDGTLEMRFWHCARSGEEARKINEIIIAWINTLAKEQKDKIPLSFKMNDFSHLDTHEKIIKCFDNFCERIGLNPKEYYGLLHLS